MKDCCSICRFVATVAITGFLFASGTFAATGVCDVVPPRAIEVEATAGTPQGGYDTLAEALATINAGTHSGTIFVEVCGNTTEPAAGAVLNASGSGAASYTSISIQPVGGASRTVSGAATAGLALIDLNGADNVTIDGVGSGGNALTISNTQTSGGSTIRFVNGANDNVVTNATVLGSSSAGTIGGTIYFNSGSDTMSTNTNDTISNCNIGPAGTMPGTAIFATGTIDGNTNSNIVITNNNIYDFFKSSNTGTGSVGIWAQGWNVGWAITNNRLYQTGARDLGAEGSHTVMSISGGEGFTITGNVIGYGSANQTGTYSVQGGRGAFSGIVFGGRSPGLASSISNNTIASLSVFFGRSAGGLLSVIYISSGEVVTNNNTIKSVSFGTESHDSGASLCVLCNGAANVDWTANGNTFDDISMSVITGFSQLRLLSAGLSPGQHFNASSNVLGGTGASSIHANSNHLSADLTGISASGGAANLVGNTIRNFYVSAEDGGSLVGIDVNANGLDSNNVAQNVIHSVTTSFVPFGFSPIVTGISFRNGRSVCKNNMISLGAGLSDGASIRGIWDRAGSPDQANSYYFNSVYIGGSGVDGAANTYAFTTSHTTTRSICQDNIFFNARSNGSGTGGHYAIDDSTTGSVGLTSDYNVLYVSGQGGRIGRSAGVDSMTLPEWQVSTGRDLHSIPADPGFVSATDLHVASPGLNPGEDAGAPLAEVTTDFDGEPRSMSHPDIGADEIDRCAGVTCQAADVCASSACNAATGTCASSFLPATTVCRSAIGECDLAEMCTGASPACPSDAKRTDTCRLPADSCDAAESCDGATDVCPPDVVAPAGMECRNSAGDCDVAEACDGINRACPADAFLSGTTECRASTDTCDPAENCPGNRATCPQDVVDASVAVGNSLHLGHDRQTAITTITWAEVDPGPYNVYRGERTNGAAWSYNQTCFVPGLIEATTTDAMTPAFGQLFFYLISREEQSCGESSLGFDSTGVIRPNPDACAN